MKHRLVITGILLSTTLVSYGQNWYRGSLHGHSYWSDGNTFPELAIHEYKTNGIVSVLLLSLHGFFKAVEKTMVAFRDSGQQKIRRCGIVCV